MVGLVNGLVFLPFLVGRQFLILAMFVFFIPIGSFGQVFSGASLTLLPFLGLALGALWFVDLLVGSGRPLRFREAKWLGLLGVLAILSTIANADRMHGLLPFLTHIQLIVLTIVVAHIVGDESKFRVLGWLIILSLTGVAIITVLSHLGLGTAFNQEIEQDVIRGVAVVRYGSSSGGINWASAEFLVGIVLAVNFLMLERTLFRGLVLAGCLFVLVFADILTYSLGGWAALLVALGVSLGRAKGIRIRSAVRTLIIAAVLGGLLVTFVPGFRLRIQSKSDQIRVQESGQWFSKRLGTSLAGIRLLRNEPLLGVGPGNSRWLLPQYLPYYETNEVGAHSTFLELGNELGVPALTAFLAVLVSALGGLLRVERRQTWPGGAGGMARMSRAVNATLVGLALLSFVEGLERFKYLWLFLGLAIAIRIRSKSSGAECDHSRRSGVPGTDRALVGSASA